MKATFSVSVLQHKLAQLSSVVKSSPNSPIYGYILLSVSSAGASLSGNDIAASLTVQIPVVSVAKEGSVLLPAKVLRDLVSTLPEEEVTLEAVDASSLKLKSGRYSAKLHTELVENFPKFPKEEFTFRTSLGLSVLLTLAEKSSFAVPPNDGKFSVNTALLESTGKHILLVGTDGHRLAVASVDASAAAFKLPLPKTALELLSALTGGETVDIKESEGAFIFETSLDTLLVRKTSGQFPPYEKLFPNGFKTQIKVDQKELLSAIERQLPLADKEVPAIVFETLTDKLSFHADSAVAGESEDDIAVKVTGPVVTFKLNGEHVRQFLDHAEGEVVINIGGEKQSAANADVVDFNNGENYRYVIVPL
jgi:DNA polymerase-3 subunit beta